MSDRKPNQPKGLYELYQNDPDHADEKVFGRQSYPDRRGFLKGAGLATMAAVLGGAIPFHRSMPSGIIPAAFAEGLEDVVIEGKDGLTVLNDRPVNAETPPHLLDDDITPTARHFIRNNGLPPTEVDADNWTLTIDGLVEQPMTLTLAQLKSEFEVVTEALLIECGGNGRAFFDPKAKGNQWTYGAVACSQWSGVRLSDLLKKAGVKSGAVYTAHYGADKHLSGQPDKLPISRGVPIEKAMRGDILVAFEQNGEPLHPMNGAPLRLVVPGWPGSCSQKWLTRIEIRDQVHDGPKMTGTAYRVPNRPVAPGEKVAKEDFVIIERMPVKSLITAPQTNSKVSGKQVTIRGHAWSGDRKVASVEVSKDFGATWEKATLNPPVNEGAWQTFTAKVDFPEAGYYEVWAKATDDQGISQPFAIAWNPKGYLNNSYHRIALMVG
ncbi:molybdopterin-dependent oxidoreductase [Ferrimonas balearica]|uniref:molybdopterin-dependent oxidoreductase n=1 Tax=Ferrimonas balearica TaxID=44012 RepID=UPI001C940ED9|nr:molybdopterin-dependent oxidoreductase [Ferrimonas balearica]MBY5978680.1 molybdopterin-dependent oxidoreductase [Ferrimonas balearica]MBY6224838.1 molybdopterin-dependent oxidoreductase [Ferrimonas balearica]